MKKFKTNESGFLDKSYNFEGIKKQFQDEISRNKSKLKDFREGTDYIVSYENDGQKKIYNVHSLQLKKVYWGGNIPNGFEYSIEEDNEGVRTKMKMIGAVGENSSYRQDYVENINIPQKSIEGNSVGQVAFVSNDELTDKISSLRKELRQKEQDIQNLANYPKKQGSIRVEVENIKASIKELTEKSLKKSNEGEISTNKEIKKDNSGRDKGGGGYIKPLFLGGLFFLSLIGVVFAKVVR